MALRTGKEYLSRLRDGRRIYYEGRVVNDVTAEPGFRRTALAVAQYYDFQNLPQFRELMAYRAEDGEWAGISFKETREKEDLHQRAASYAAWAEVTCGFMGRSPDYMNTCMMAVGASRHYLSAISDAAAERAHRVYLDARRRDLCMTHTFVGPFQDRSKSDQERSQEFRVVRETDEGVVVTGARALATLAPFSDASLNMEIRPSVDRAGVPYSCNFVVPINAEGLNWVCRDSFNTAAAHFDSPLAGKADELDCVAIFDECLIPWEQVVGYVKGADELRRVGAWSRFAWALLKHQVLVRNIAKTRFIVGLAHLLAESSKVSQFLNVKGQLGLLVKYLRTLETFAVAAVEGAERHPQSGLWAPNHQAVELGIIWYGEFYQKMISVLMDLGGSRPVSTPHERTLDLLGEAIEDYFRGGSKTARESVGLHRLAWDLIGSAWGARQDLYERFHFGHASVLQMNLYDIYNKQQAVEMVRRILTPPAGPEQPFPLP